MNAMQYGWCSERISVFLFHLQYSFCSVLGLFVWVILLSRSHFHKLVHSIPAHSWTGESTCSPCVLWICNASYPAHSKLFHCAHCGIGSLLCSVCCTVHLCAPFYNTNSTELNRSTGMCVCVEYVLVSSWVLSGQYVHCNMWWNQCYCNAIVCIQIQWTCSSVK